MQTSYFKRYWEESTGQEPTDSWGRSTFYFETDDEYYVQRQLQLFENGKVLRYHMEYLDDEFGGLAEGALDGDEFEEYRISRDEFEEVWKMSDATPR